MSVTDPGGYDLRKWEDCRANLDHKIERRRIESLKKDFVAGPYFTVSFPDIFTDQALNHVWKSTGGKLVSVSHKCSEVYDWGTRATFNIGVWPN